MHETNYVTQDQCDERRSNIAADYENLKSE